MPRNSREIHFATSSHLRKQHLAPKPRGKVFSAFFAAASCETLIIAGDGL